MRQLTYEAHRSDMLNRLKRAEGQLRGIQRMISEDEPCLDIATQLSAVRRALDSACVRMTVCFMQQEMIARLSAGQQEALQMDDLLEEVQTLLNKMK